MGLVFFQGVQLWAKGKRAESLRGRSVMGRVRNLTAAQVASGATPADRKAEGGENVFSWLGEESVGESTLMEENSHI